MIKCEQCGERMNVDRSVVLTSYPPQYACTCPKCGNIQYELCSLCDSDQEELKEYLSKQSIKWKISPEDTLIVIPNKNLPY